jgi:tetratricopeptide (TPR) repeat protein
MGAHYVRASLLFGQSKYDLAEKELVQELAQDPQSGSAHALLALCLAAQEKFDPATREARQAIHLAPDAPFSHYAMGHVMLDRGRLDEAEAAALEAFRLDPADADFSALLAQVRLNRRRWPAALEAAEEGLRNDPEHVACANLRAMALIKLGRKSEAGATLEAALARDPEDALSHANQGWALIEQGEPAKALDHFREALRIEPGLEHARAGIVEALKARNVVYRLMLRYFLWMARLSQKAQWAVVLGGYLGYRALKGVQRANPALAPAIEPLLWAYGLFALMTWIASPLFNLALRLNRFGRLALSREQIVESNWIGGFLLTALVCLAAWLASRHPLPLGAALVFGAGVIPLSGTFNCRAGWARSVMAVYTAAIVVAGLGAFGLPAVLGRAGTSLSDPLLIVFMLGCFLSGWVANALMSVRAKR